MLQNEAEQVALSLFSLAKRKPYVLEKIGSYKICYLSVADGEFSGFTTIFIYDLIDKETLLHDLYVRNEDVVEVLTGYFI